MRPPATPAPATPAPSKPRRFRRGLRALLALAVLAILLRVALALLLPAILGRVARGMGFDLAIDSIHLSLHSGEIEARGAVVSRGTGANAKETLARLEYLYADLSVRDLLSGRLRIERAEVDGLWCRIARDAAGRWNLAAEEKGAAASAPAAAPRPQENSSPAPGPRDFALPVEVTALRVQHVSVEYRDEAATPPVRTSAVLTLRGDDLGSGEKEGTVSLTATSPECLDWLQLEARVEARKGKLAAAVDFRADGFRPAPIAGILAFAGISPDAARLDAALKVEAQLLDVAREDRSLDLEAQLSEVRVEADREPAASLGSLSLRVARLRDAEATGVVVSLKGLQGAFDVRPGGAFVAAGLAFGAGPARAAAEGAPPASAPAQGAPFRWDVEEISLDGLSARLTDRTVDPPVVLEAALGGSVRGLTNDPSPSAGPMQARLEANVPGVAGAVRLAATARPFADPLTLQAEIEASGLRPERIRPYLERAGVRSELRDGALRLSARTEISQSGTVLRAKGEVSNVALRDGAELAALERAGLDGFEWDSSSGRIRARSIAISGARLPLAVGEGGALRAAGLAFGAAPPSAAGGAASHPKDREKAPASAPPTVEIGSIVVRDVSLPYHLVRGAETLETAVVLRAFDVEGLHLGPPGADSRPAMRLRAEASVAGLVDSIGVKGTVPLLDPVSGRAEIAAEASVRGVRPALFTAWFRSAQLDPNFLSAEGSLSAEASFTRDGGDLLAEARVRDLALRALGSPLFSWDFAEVAGVRSGAAGTSIERVVLRGLYVAAGREADGRLRMAGLRLPKAAAAESQPGTVAPAPAPASAPTPAPTRDTADGTAPRIGRVALEGARLRWEDDFAARRARADLSIDATASRPAAGAGAKPFPIEAQVSLGGVAAVLGIRGELGLDPARLSAQLAIEGHGLGGDLLDSYLPSGARTELANGDLQLGLRLDWNDLGAGAHALRFEAGPVDLRERGASRPLLHVDRWLVNAERVDPGQRVFRVEEAALDGLELLVDEPAPGSLRFLGLRFERPATSPAAPAEPSGLTGLRARVQGGALPEVRIGKLRLEARSLVLRSGATEESPTFQLAALLELAQPARILDDDSDAIEPIVGRLRLASEGMLREAEVKFNATPFAARPEIDLELAARGISGAVLERRIPALAPWIRQEVLSEAEIDARLHASCLLERDSVLEFDFGRRPFTLDAVLSGLALRGRPGGEPLAALASLEVSGAQLDLAKRRARIRRIDVGTPALRVVKDAAGTHVAGFTIPGGPATESSGAQPQGSERPAEPPRYVGSAPAAPFDVAIGAITASGLDFSYRDETSTPPLAVPLTDLNAYVQGYSTRAIENSVPLRFGFQLYAGRIPLKRRYASSSLLAGLAQGAAQLVTAGGDSEPEMADRPLFEEIAFQGQLAFTPEITGRTRLEIAGLELQGLRGPASGSGVTIGDGVLDARVDAHFEGDEGATFDTKSTFSHLSVSESAGGPISTYLKLPAPLDAVLFLLKTPNGDQKLAFSFHVGESGVSTGAITAEATKELSRQIALAIANAPLRILRVAGDAAGITGGPGSSDRDRLVYLWFEPGEAVPPPEEWRGLENLAEEIRSGGYAVQLRHEYAAADLARLASVANPSREECLDLVARLRQRRFELLQQRDTVAAEAYALAVLGQREATERRSRELRTLDRALGDTEASLDEVSERLRSGVDPRRERRSRELAFALAESRLERARAALVRAGVPADRIELRGVRVDPGDAARSAVILQRRARE